MHYYTDVLKKYAVFEGRARRKEYWMFFLFNFIVSVILSIVSPIVGDKYGAISLLYMLAVLVPAIGVSIRRMHDIGKSGWWIFISLIPIAGPIWALVLVCTDSNPGQNMYGPNPKETITPIIS
jgi:uncharacterized membrane protein YhaH (DUF805 family)